MRFAMLAVFCLLAAETYAQEHKPSVAILPPEHLTTATRSPNYLDHLLPNLIANAVQDSGIASVVHPTSVEFALHTLRIPTNRVPTALELCAIAIESRADVVVAPRIDQIGRSDAIIIQIRGARTNAAITTLANNSLNADIAISNVLAEVSKRLRRPLSTAPLSQIPKSSAVLKHLGLAMEEGIAGKPLLSIENHFREALTLDPKCAIAHQGLAHALALQNKLAEAEAEASSAIRLNANYALAHYRLGRVYLMDQFPDKAKDEFLRAILYNPDAPEPFVGLCDVREIEQHRSQALAALKEAIRLAPNDPATLARYGLLCVQAGDTNEARTQFTLAQRCLFHSNAAAEQELGIGYDVLNEPSSARRHFEAFLRQARATQARSAGIDTIERRLAALEGSISPTRFPAAPPESIDAPTLKATLREKLNSTDFSLVTNPLACTKEMTRFARTLVKGSVGEEQKARRLFDSVAARLDPSIGDSTRTARETFAAWDDRSTSFTCQEYAFLYIALARAVGLNSFYVTIEQDCYGRTVPHACAGVFIKNQLLLVDPLYSWFGAPHKSFTVQNDIQTVALYMSQLDDPRLARVAMRLAPERPITRAELAICLAHAGSIPEARSLLASAPAAEPNWMAAYAHGLVDFYAGDLDTARAQFHSAAALAPDFSQTHFYLGIIAWRQKKLDEARDELRIILSEQQVGPLAEEARKALHKIDLGS